MAVTAAAFGAVAALGALAPLRTVGTVGPLRLLGSLLLRLLGPLLWLVGALGLGLGLVDGLGLVGALGPWSSGRASGVPAAGAAA